MASSVRVVIPTTAADHDARFLKAYMQLKDSVRAAIGHRCVRTVKVVNLQGGLT